MFLLPPKASRNVGVAAAMAKAVAVAAAETVTTVVARSAIPNGRSGWFRSAASPRP